VRIIVYVLVTLNVVYLAWAGWVDVPPQQAAAGKTGSSLPELVLVTEGVTRTSPARTAEPIGVQPIADLTQPALSRPEARGRCVSVGPFNDLAHAARGAALLRERGFDPRQRAEEGEMWDGFWVYIGGLESREDEVKVLKALERAGINDARVMPETGDRRRVSIGLFSERDRAEKRAQAVQRLGLSPQIIERRQPGTVYWVDLDLGSSDRAVPTEGLLSLESAGSRVEIRVCPNNSAPAVPPQQQRRPQPTPRDARPAATTADAGVPRPS